jgi:hypothetical protein
VIHRRQAQQHPDPQRRSREGFGPESEAPDRAPTSRRPG